MQGTFWTTEDPTVRRRGDLDVERGLVVFGDGHLVETMEVLERTAVTVSCVPRSLTNLEFTVHGDLDDGTKVTIPHAIVGSYTDQTQEIRFLKVLEGVHADAEQRYVSASIDFCAPHNASISTWRLAGVVHAPGVGEVTLSCKGSTIEFTDFRGILETEVERSLINPLVNLLMLITHEMPKIEHLSMIPMGGTGYERHSVREKGSSQNEMSGELSPLASIVPLRYFGIGEIDRWFKVNAALNPVCAVIGTTISSKELTVESRVLHLAASVEAVHREFFRTTERMTKAEAKEVCSMATDAVPESRKSAVRELLSSLQYPTFAERLKEMLNNVGPMASAIAGERTSSSSDALLGRAAWIQAIKQRRNVFAHQKPHTPDNLPTFADEMFVLFESLQWLLTISLLNNIGIGLDEISAEIAEASQFQLFRERSLKIWPSIYGSGCNS